ncbi:MAG: glycerol kinase GlpK [Myxococcales bacterium FL481]|nr:MAG: glycerol kinase GlpK [Myxococcales bacterium FL481]
MPTTPATRSWRSPTACLRATQLGAQRRKLTDVATSRRAHPQERRVTTAADCILAIDQGTTGSTCLLVNGELDVLARSTQPFPQHFPRPGWVEHDPSELWRSVCDAIVETVHASGVHPSRIAAIGITNQRETTVVWDRASGQPIHRAIVWQDRRTADRCHALREAGLEETFRDRTGLVLDPYFSGTKLGWLFDHVPGSREAGAQGKLLAGTVDTYLLWRLTGGRRHVTEPTNASRTLLWPLTARAGDGAGWDRELCAHLEVPPSVLPDVLPCTADFGTTRDVPGLPDGIPIRGVAGDQQAALFGQACFEPGEAKCTYGTGAFAMLNTGASPVRSTHGLLTTVAWQIDDSRAYALEGSAFMAGAVVQWLRDGLGLFDHAADIEGLAASVTDSGGVVLVPAHAGLGAPHWRPDARGLITGLTRGTTSAHLCRAALEGIALTVEQLIRSMIADYGTPLRSLKVDGGAAANNLLMQIQADLLNVELARPTMLEATALGAIALAGLGVGLWPDTGALREAWREDRTFKPVDDAPRLADLREAFARATASA